MERDHTSSVGGDRRKQRLTARRLAVRLGAMVVTLIAIDLLLSAYLSPGHGYGADWRLPREQSMSALPGYAEHIESLPRDSRRPVVLFLGASPTWGEMNSDRHHTYPAAFARVARKAGSGARVYNLGANGELVADQYFIAGRLAAHSDLAAFQLTYHTFNPAARTSGSQRFPDFPRILGQAVGSRAASALGIDRTPPFNLSGAVDRALGRHWALYGEHEELTTRVFGRPLRNELYARWQKATRTAPPRTPQVSRLPRNVSFDGLDPSRQTAIVERYADVADFRIKPGNSELRMLELLCERLERGHRHAAFFISPLDIAALRDFQVFDRRQYNANARLIRAVVERHGLTFIDWNQPRLELPRTAFADLTHTTDAGSALFSQRLYKALAPLLATAEEGR
ncbi:MAG: SGNH/GDSL hydrolase family protein [Gaiellaceae bacterium]